jgi:hypothetical protein
MDFDITSCPHPRFPLNFSKGLMPEQIQPVMREERQSD